MRDIIDYIVLLIAGIFGIIVCDEISIKSTIFFLLLLSGFFLISYKLETKGASK